jgi:hypothetical protein
MKTIRILLLLALPFCSFSQLTENKFHFLAKYGIGKVATANYSTVSLAGEWFVHPNIGLNYSFEWMERSDNIRQIHTPMGIVGGPILIVGSFLSSGGDTTRSGIGAALGILLLVLPDGVSFHLPASYKWDISPYANILGLDFIRDRNMARSYLKYACSFGLKSTYGLTEKIKLTAFLETRQAARFGWSFGGGIGLGMVFGNRSATNE